MLKGVLILLFTIVFQSLGYAAYDTTNRNQHKDLRVSFLYCGVGNATWQTFGHCAVRIIDSTKDSLHSDLTYNYGIFDYFEGTLEHQFLKGRIRVALETTTFRKFVKEYREDGRSVEEIELLLDEEAKERIQTFLDSNALIENKYYTYHFFFDNCTVRVRDLFPKALGPGFVYGKTIPDNAHLTFNDGYNMYFTHKYWYKMLANIFFGSATVIPMDGYQVMFLPDYLTKGIEGATYNGKKVCGQRREILKDNIPALPGINMPFLLSLLLAILTVAGLGFPRLRIMGKIMAYVVLFLTSFIGIAILYAWFGTEYDLSRNNYNILWALPTSILLPFLPRVCKKWYALISLFLICLAILVHIAHIQRMLLFELVPLWIALFAIYGRMYRDANVKG